MFGKLLDGFELLKQMEARTHSTGGSNPTTTTNPASSRRLKCGRVPARGPRPQMMGTARGEVQGSVKIADCGAKNAVGVNIV